MTKDLDLLGFGDPSVEQLVEKFVRICDTEVPDDGLAFDAASVEGAEIRETASYPGVRVTLKGRLGSARLNL